MVTKKCRIYAACGVSQTPISQEFREDVSIMCNLSQGIEDKAIAKIVMNMYKIGYTPNQIADAVGVSVDEVETIIKKKEPAMA